MLLQMLATLLLICCCHLTGCSLSATDNFQHGSQAYSFRTQVAFLYTLHPHLVSHPRVKDPLWSGLPHVFLPYPPHTLHSCHTCLFPLSPFSWLPCLKFVPFLYVHSSFSVFICLHSTYHNPIYYIFYVFIFSLPPIRMWSLFCFPLRLSQATTTLVTWTTHTCYLVVLEVLWAFGIHLHSLAHGSQPICKVSSATSSRLTPTFLPPCPT